MKRFTVKKLIEVLKKTPEQKFRIMELAPKLIDDKGKVNITRCIDQHGELNLAILEVESYIKSTREAVEALKWVDGEKMGTDDEPVDELEDPEEE